MLTYETRRKIRRETNGLKVSLSFIGLLFLIVYSIIPLLTDQVNDLITSVPTFIDNTSKWISGIFENISSNTNINLNGFKNDIFTSLSDFGRNMTNVLPTKIMSIISSLISGIGVFGLGLIIGFYMLFNFDNVSKTLISFLPKKIRKDTSVLLGEVNETLLHFVRGTLTVSLVIFVTNYIGFLGGGPN